MYAAKHLLTTEPLAAADYASLTTSYRTAGALSAPMGRTSPALLRRCSQWRTADGDNSVLDARSFADIGPSRASRSRSSALRSPRARRALDEGRSLPAGGLHLRQPTGSAPTGDCPTARVSRPPRGRPAPVSRCANRRWSASDTSCAPRPRPRPCTGGPSRPGPARARAARRPAPPPPGTRPAPLPQRVPRASSRSSSQARNASCSKSRVRPCRVWPRCQLLVCSSFMFTPARAVGSAGGPSVLGLARRGCQDRRDAGRAGRP